MGPDLFFENRYALQNAAASGLYQPIMELARKKGINASDFIAGPWSECVWNGELYAIPHWSEVGKR